MGSQSSKSDSNSSKSDSDSSSNSGNKNGKLETMDGLKENENTIINRVWIVKKSITLNDGHVINFDPFFILKFKKPIKLLNPKANVFKIKNECNSHFKHWAIILELSNDSYVNIQFGRNGFSLKEYNQTDIKGENVFYSIIETWGEDDSPFSFCYLGEANYQYDKLKNTLNDKKKEESKRFEEKGETYYNACVKNCQHFACDIEKILFSEIKGWHSFDFYLDQFFDKFFPNIDLGILKLKYENSIKKENEELFKLNLKIIKDYINEKMNNKISERKKKLYEKEELYYKEVFEDLYSLKCDDYLNE